MKRFLRLLLTPGLAAGLFFVALLPTAQAIKIVVPDQYQDQVDSAKAAERAERERELDGPASSPSTADAGSAEISESGIEQPSAPAAAPASDDLAPQPVVEAETAAFEGSLAEDQGIVSGQVLDKESGQPVSGAAIIIEGTDVATVTGADGRYTLGPAPAGTYTLSFIKTGYIEANVTEYQVVGGEVSVFPFALPPRPADMSDEVYELQDFTVTAEQANQMMLEIDLRRSSLATLDMLSAEDFSKFAASDAAEAISKMSGASLSDGKYVVMRGLNDRYNTTLINGVRLPSPDPDRKAVALDIFPTSLFEGITVQKTYTSDMPGESSGGAVGLKTKSVPEEPFIKFSFSAGGQMTSNDTDVFLGDPEQASLGEWLTGDDRRGFDVRSGTDKLVDDYPNNVGGEGFPLTAPHIKRMSKFGDRSYNLSFGGSREVADWLTLGAVVGVKVDEKRRTSFKELYKTNIEQGYAVLDERAQKGNTRIDANGNEVPHGGVLKSEEEYSTSALVGLGAKIGDHTTLNYTFLRSETLTSTAERVDYQQYVGTETPKITDSGTLPTNTYYSFTDYEVGSEEKLLEAHQFSGEHVFDFLRLSDWKFSWYHTMAAMEQSEPDQRLIAEFIPDQFGVELNAFDLNPGLANVSRFQRETEQDSTMNGFKIEQEVELMDGIRFGFNFGYDNEKSERDFRQLESIIEFPSEVDDLLFAAMPYPDARGQGVSLADAVDPDNSIFLYNDGFVDQNLGNGVNKLVETLYDQAVGGVNDELRSLNVTLNGQQKALDLAQIELSSAQTNFNNQVAFFETALEVDYETQYDPENPDHVSFFTNFISPAEQALITQQAAVNIAQTNLDTTQDETIDARETLDTITAEQLQYLSDAVALIAQISSMPALAMDPTAFPTFSFFGNQNYILETPRGFSVYADKSPTASNIQFSSVDGLFQAKGENEVESFYISGSLTFSELHPIESLRIAGGIRSESTKLSYELLPNHPDEPDPLSLVSSGVSPRVAESSSIDQRDQLGYLAFIFDITDSLKLHLSKSKTVAKPTFREIAPFPIFNLSDKSFELGNPGFVFKSAGQFEDWQKGQGDYAAYAKADPAALRDPNLSKNLVVGPNFAGLEIAEVDSFDIRFEYFTPFDGLISIGFFSKKIEAPIERVLAYEASGVAVNTFINNDNNAKIKGLEFEVKQNLGIIDLPQITIGGNYTKLDAEVTRSAFEMENLSNELYVNLEDPNAFQKGGQFATRPLYDQPEFIANAFVSLDIEETGTRITLSQNWLGEQLNRAGGFTRDDLVGTADLYWDRFSSMNLVIEQEINATWSLKFAVKNLDSPVRTMSEKSSFYDALIDPALYENSAPAGQISAKATGRNRSSQRIEPSYSISISASF